MPNPHAPATLGRISGVTVSAHDLDAVEAAYTGYLGYRVQHTSEVSPQQADLWGCEAMTGASVLAMSPSATDDFVFRFVQRNKDPEYVPYTTYGWNAAEIIVRDVDELAKSLADSPFEIVGPPKDLAFTDDIRAMQVRGPADEILYLTQVKNPVPGLDLPAPRCEVDRTFIVILAGESIAQMQDYYNAKFNVPRAPVLESRITVASKAFGLSLEHRYPIAAMSLLGQSFIEVDEFPEAATPRGTPDGMLPPGIAMVSFEATLPPQGTEPQPISDALYRGYSAASCRGAADEIIELLIAD